MKSVLTCPNCGKEFNIDESEYINIVQQVRNDEFDRELGERKAQWEYDKKTAVRLAEAEKDNEISKLKGQIEKQRSENALAVMKAADEAKQEAAALRQKLTLSDMERKSSESELRRQHESELKAQKEDFTRYKEMRSKLNTKLLGESLEQHCEIEFNKLRAVAFPNAYFEKDTVVKAGGKGDYIFRETDGEGVELLSIMFEMKNKEDGTASRKNDDFLDKLHRDRTAKECEYAVLVSLLEPENELYNEGIVDKSYRYPKMYVIRPQFFIPLISLLRNAAKNAAGYKAELQRIQNREIDITNFERDLTDFKKSFSDTYQKASARFDDAINEIDKTIEHLEKVKAALKLSANHMGAANNKAEDLTIKKLTRGNDTMKAKFAELREKHDDIASGKTPAAGLSAASDGERA